MASETNVGVMLRELPPDDLWKMVPSCDHAIWRHVTPGTEHGPRWREIMELVCGAIWHMEQATKAGTFASERYEVIRNRGRLFWQIWLNSRTQPQQTPSEVRETNSALVTLVQSMLLADAALRLAGAWEIVKDLAKERQCSVATEMLNLDHAIDTNGNVKSGTKPNVRSLLILRAVRDSFMHGELSREQRNLRHKQRNLLYSSADYAAGAIYEHCFHAATAILGVFHANHSNP